jgi:hypothetical protein
MQMKRDEFLLLNEAKHGSKRMPNCILRQDSRYKHAISSLSSSSGSSNQNSSSEEEKQNERIQPTNALATHTENPEDGTSGSPSDEVAATKVSSSGGSGNSSNESNTGSDGGRQSKQQDASQGFHDYHAKPLPDPKLEDSERSSPSGDDSPEESNDNASNGGTKRVSTDSSSGDDSAAAIARPSKRRKHQDETSSSVNMAGHAVYASRTAPNPLLPPNIAKKGGIPHNVQPAGTSVSSNNGIARIGTAPAIPLPPFTGIGKNRSVASDGHAAAMPTISVPQGKSIASSAKDGAAEPTVLSAEVETSSSSSGRKRPQIRAYYHINEDDMILMEDFLMCPFIFRSQDAVLCGALSECVMPGMLRAHFSPRNKLVSVEMVYDAMGFMQLLERASGNEGTFQIIPGSLEMALAPINTEARVITLAEAPFLIVNVNAEFTKTTGYTQLEAEGKEYLSLLGGEGTIPEACERANKPVHKLEEVANGRCACSTNIHYDRDGQDFIEYVCSYPLTNSNDEVTHLLHVHKELPSLQNSVHD